MKNPWSYLLTALPRWAAATYSMLYIVPLTLEWFVEKYGVWDSVTHMFSAIVLIAALVRAWKRKPMGTILFFTVGAWYLTEVGGRLSGKITFSMLACRSFSEHCSCLN